MFLTFLLLTSLTLTTGNVINKEHQIHPEFKETRIPTPKELTESSSEFWLEQGKKHLSEKLERKLNENVAKNVIFFLGDGMSTPTLAAARVLQGGEEEFLSFEKFPFIGLSKTYCTDFQVADSACTATAYLTGVKGNYGTTGVNGRAKRGDCSAHLDKTTQTKSIAKWAADSGKLVGFVTNARVTHASPSGLYANTADRDWEDDSLVLEDCDNADKPIDIAIQLMESEIDFKVILGGGRKHFIGKSSIDEAGYAGSRADERNLIDEWKQKRVAKGDKYSYVWNKNSLKSVEGTTDYLFGLFNPGHMLYHFEAVESTEPSLLEMTEKAIEILSKGENGFFLFVEGGKIDMAHHGNLAHVSLDETLEFSKAVDYARNKLSEDDSLIVVTSDHSHTMSISGYPNRGADILGTTGLKADDHLLSMTLSYANGPEGFVVHHDPADISKRVDVTTLDQTKFDFAYPATIKVGSETHGGDDVAIFASGPWAHLFTKTVEQSVIPHFIAFAACFGDGLKSCD